MRARNIKPGLYKNEELANCSVWARYLCPGLWMMADRNGRLEDRPKRIKAELLAYDSVEVEPLLCELAHHGHLVRYEVGGNRFIQIRNFSKHQNPHYTERAGIIPPPPHGDDEAITPGVLPESSGSKPASKPPLLPPDSLIHRFTDSSLPIGNETHAAKPKNAKPGRKPSQACKLPFDSLPPEWAEWTRAKMNWSPDVIADVWACFRDYWQRQPDKKAQKSDWQSTWRMWCRQQIIHNSGENHATTIRYSGQSARPSKSDRFKQALVDSTCEELGVEGRPGGDKDSI